MHFPGPTEDPIAWGVLSAFLEEECDSAIAETAQLDDDGIDPDYDDYSDEDPS